MSSSERKARHASPLQKITHFVRIGHARSGFEKRNGRFGTPVLVLLVVLSITAAGAPKPKLPERYAKWLNQEAVYIITDEERKAFLALPSDEQRDKFIQDFWDIRNPNPGSDRNAYKEEHYSRLEYANSHFGSQSNTPGWMTDMGRTWILLGKPTSEHPFTGYSQIYPLELWFYDNPARFPSLPSFFYVMFYMPGDIGEYKFYRPFLDGPMKLVRGSRFNSNADVYRFLQPLGGDVAHASLSLIAGDPIDTRTFQPELASDMLVSKIQNLANDHFNIQQLRTRRAMRELVTSRVLSAGTDLNLSAVVLTDPLHEKWLDYSVPIEDEQMGVRTDDGQFALDFRYSVLTENGTLVMEDQGQRKYPAYESSSAFVPFAVAGRIPLVPGKYRLEVQVVNHKTSWSYRGHASVSIPAEGQTSWISGPLLADSVSRAPQSSALTPFQYYGIQFHPLARRQLGTKAPLRVLYQLYEPQPSDYDVEYVLANLVVREARIVSTDHVASSEFKDHLLLKSKTLDTSALPYGEYMLAIQLKAGTGSVITSTNERLRILEKPLNMRLFFETDPAKLAKPGVIDYMRGLAAVAQHNDAGAEKYLKRSLELNPANSFATLYLAQAYYRQHRYKAVSDLYRSSSLKDFQVSPEVMAQIAVSLWDSGDFTQAKTVLKTARSLFPEDALLAATARFFSTQKN
ncbi:MAG TPA: GWxTD domain-containing protein [Bryobacteraceae bacterium]